MKYRIAWLASVAVAAALYFWIIGIGPVPKRFAWERQIERFYGSPPERSLAGADAVNGYYELLGRSFARGKLRLPVEPLPELLALRNPWSGLDNWQLRLLDAALFDRHYYLYHGPTPALLLFAPWYLLTGRDLPENFAAFVVALLAFVFLSRLFCDVLASLDIRLPLPLFALFLAALATAQVVPFLLHRAKVYEVAILGGYLCVSAGFYCAFQALIRARRQWLWAAFSGLSLGLAVGCRPHLGLAAVAVFFLFAARRRELLAFLTPLAVCGLALMAYNYARFQSPFEFGTRYLLGDDRYRDFGVSAANLVPGLYYLLLSPLRLAPEFPFARLALREHMHFFGHALPVNYFLEPIGGALALSPLILLALFAPFLAERGARNRAVRNLLIAVLLFAAACVLFVALVPFSSQRYSVDFLPFLLFIGCVGAAAWWQRIPGGWPRAIVSSLVSLVLIYSIGANLGLAIQGPYDQLVQAHPHEYVNLARWFSPTARFRPLWNPPLKVSGSFEFPACPAQREPLLSAGEFGSRYLLSAECAAPGRIRLISESSVRHPDVQSVELPFAPGRDTIGLEFTPGDSSMSASWNGVVVMRHKLRFLVTSPSQVRFGWDPSLGNPTRFEGRIQPSPHELGYLLK